MNRPKSGDISSTFVRSQSVFVRTVQLYSTAVLKYELVRARPLESSYSMYLGTGSTSY